MSSVQVAQLVSALRELARARELRVLERGTAVREGQGREREKNGPAQEKRVAVKPWRAAPALVVTETRQLVRARALRRARAHRLSAAQEPPQGLEAPRAPPRERAGPEQGQGRVLVLAQPPGQKLVRAWQAQTGEQPPAQQVRRGPQPRRPRSARPQPSPPSGTGRYR